MSNALLLAEPEAATRGFLERHGEGARYIGAVDLLIGADGTAAFSHLVTQTFPQLTVFAGTETLVEALVRTMPLTGCSVTELTVAPLGVR